MSEHNSDIDIDIDIDIVESPSDTTKDTVRVVIKQEGNEELDQVAEEPITESKALSKETRKLRKKKNFDSDSEDNTVKKTKKAPTPTATAAASSSIKQEEPATQVNEEPNSSNDNTSVKADSPPKPLTRKVSSFDVFNGDADIDDLDTDDLLDEVDRLPILRKSYINSHKKLTRKRATPPAEQRGRKVKKKKK
jgi:hypothetical protein